MGPYGEYCIEKKNTLLSPAGEITRIRNLYTQILVQLFEDINKTWRKLGVVLNRKT